MRRPIGFRPPEPAPTSLTTAIDLAGHDGPDSAEIRPPTFEERPELRRTVATITIRVFAREVRR